MGRIRLYFIRFMARESDEERQGEEPREEIDIKTAQP